jgi:hypothetical protein
MPDTPSDLAVHKSEVVVGYGAEVYAITNVLRRGFDSNRLIGEGDKFIDIVAQFCSGKLGVGHQYATHKPAGRSRKRKAMLLIRTERVVCKSLGLTECLTWGEEKALERDNRRKICV